MALTLVAPSENEIVPLTVGTTIPNPTVTLTNGHHAGLADLVAGEGAAAIVFYRGGWCPYCNAQLADLAGSAEALGELGVRIVGVTPDSLGELRKTEATLERGVTLVSDAGADALKAFGVAFRLPDETHEIYLRDYGIDVERASGETHRLLPVPSVFLVDAAGVVRFVHADPDFKVRLSGDALLAAARAL